MQLALEVRNPLIQLLSTIGMLKHTSPTDTLQMTAEISFLSLVPTEGTAQQNVHKVFVLYIRNLIFVVPSIMLYSSEISPTRCNKRAE
jgi:hypothetical protein